MKKFTFFAVLVVAVIGAGASARAADCYVNSVGDFICDSPPTDLPSNTNDSWTAPPDSGTIPPQIAKDLQDYYSGTSDDPVISPPPPPPSTPPKPPSADDFTIAHNKGFCAAGDSVACQWLCDRGFKEYCSCSPIAGPPPTTTCVPTGNSIVKADHDFCSLDQLRCSGNCPKVVNEGGKCYGDFTLTRDMPTSYRTEVVSQGGKLDFGKGYSISYDFNFADYAKDSDAETGAFQVHQTPFDWLSHGKADTGACSGASQVSEGLLTTIVKDDTFNVYTYGGKLQYSAPIKKLQWQTAQWNIIPSKGSDGLIELTLNGEKVFSVSGQNVPVADRCGRPFREPYPKFGIYKWNWREGRPDTDSNRRQLLLGNIKIVEGEAVCTTTPAVAGSPVIVGNCGGGGSSTTCTPTGNSITRFDIDFEDGMEVLKDHNIGGTTDVVPSPRGDGNAGKYELNYKAHTDPNLPKNEQGSYRAETYIEDGQHGALTFDKEYWFSLDYNMADWATDSDAESGPLQVHRNPGSWAPGCGGQVSAYSNAPFLMHTSNGMTRFITWHGKVEAEWPVEQGVWKNIKIHTKITREGDNSGFVEAWLDGKLLFRRDGPLSVAMDDCGNPMKDPYMNVGIYKWNWGRQSDPPPTDSTRRLLYVDNIKMIEGEAVCTTTTTAPTPTTGGTTTGSGTGTTTGTGGTGGATAGTPVPPGTCTGPVPTGSGSTTLNVVSHFNDQTGYKDHIYEGGKNTLVSTDSRDAGGKAILFEVGVPKLTPEQCDLNRYRAEIDSKAPIIPWDDGVSHWNGVSYNPQDFKGSAYTLFQIHAPNEPKGATCDYAGNALSLNPVEKNGKMYYSLRVIEKGGQSSGTGAGSGTTEVWSTPMVEGQWADFVFNYTLSTKGQGYFQVWYNGQLVYQKSGLTNVNHIDSCGNPVPADLRESNGPHIGIYGPPCAGGAADPEPYRALLADELAVATGPDGYALVDPSKGANKVNNTCQ